MIILTITDFIESMLKSFNDQDTVLKIIEIVIATGMLLLTAGMLVVAILSMKQNEGSVIYYPVPYEPSKAADHLSDYPSSIACANYYVFSTIIAPITAAVVITTAIVLFYMKVKPIITEIRSRIKKKKN